MYCEVELESITDKRYTQEMKAYFESRKLPGSLQNVIKASYKAYGKLSEEINEILEEGEIYLLLRHLLDVAPNVYKIVFTAAYRTNRQLMSAQCGVEMIPSFHQLLLTIGTARCNIKELMITETFDYLPRRSNCQCANGIMQVKSYLS